MDLLAEAVGMSKKTIYRHFSGKEAIVDAVIEAFATDVLAMAESVFLDDALGFPAKLARFTSELTQRFSRVPPTLFRELQRYAPKVYRHIEELRSRNIPVVFGRMVMQGKRVGAVRASVDPAFATAFWAQAIQGLNHPDTSERLGLRPDQIFDQALNLFFGGLLTSEGMKDYENVSLS